MKVSAITKPIQQIARPMSKPRKAILSAVAATALALTPMTTLNAQEVNKEKVEIPAAKKTEKMMNVANWLFGAISAMLLGATIYNYKFTKDMIKANETETKETNLNQANK